MASLFSNDQQLIDQQIESERNSDFDSNSAYGEIIDNSIQANAKKIIIEFFSKPVSKKREILDYIIFGDDGLGMGPDILEKCLSNGFSSRYNNRDGIGRFGVGMTKAFLNQCLICEVYSKTKDGEWHFTFSDIQPSNKNKNQIPKPIKKKPPKEFEKFSNGKSGTIIIWKEHDKFEGSLEKLIDEFKIWTGRTYRKFIDDGVQFKINSKDVYSIDPSFLNPKKTYFPDDPKGKKIETFEILWPVDREKRKDDDHMEKIEITVSLAPVFVREGRGGLKEDYSQKFNKLQSERNIDSDWEGISILRNKREVFFGNPFPWVKGLTFEPLTRFIGVEISFNAIHDNEFKVKNIKRGAVPVITLKQAITQKIKGVFDNLKDEIRNQWDDYHNKHVKEKIKTSVLTGHELAEQIAKGQIKIKDKLAGTKNKQDAIKSISNSLLDDEQKRKAAAYEAKFANQPFTVVESAWGSKEFVQVGHTPGGAVLRYNMKHPLFKFINDLILTIDSEDEKDKIKSEAVKLKAVIDLLLFCYSRAEKDCDPEMNIPNTEDFLENIRQNWGTYLANSLRDLEKNE